MNNNLIIDAINYELRIMPPNLLELGKLLILNDCIINDNKRAYLMNVELIRADVYEKAKKVHDQDINLEETIYYPYLVQALPEELYEIYEKKDVIKVLKTLIKEQMDLHEIMEAQYQDSSNPSAKAPRLFYNLQKYEKTSKRYFLTKRYNNNYKEIYVAQDNKGINVVTKIYKHSDLLPLPYNENN